jgi:hypothetical protein
MGRAGHGHRRWQHVPGRSGVVDLDMFGALMLNRVGGEIDDNDIVKVDEIAL